MYHQWNNKQFTRGGKASAYLSCRNKNNMRTIEKRRKGNWTFSPYFRKNEQLTALPKDPSEHNTQRRRIRDSPRSYALSLSLINLANYPSPSPSPSNPTLHPPQQPSPEFHPQIQPNSKSMVRLPR